MHPSLPPGPDCGRLTQAIAFHRDPLGTLCRARRRHGDVFVLRMAGMGTFAVIAAPAAIDEVTGADAAAGHAGAARRQILPQIAERSVLGADGERHRAARARLEPVFGPEAIELHRPAVERIAEEHVARWPRGRPFRLVHRLRDLTDEVFVGLMVGIRDEQRAAALVAGVRRMLWTPGNPPLAPPGDGDGVAGALGRALWARRHAPVTRLLRAEIDERRRDGRTSATDLVDALVTAEPQIETAALADELLPLLLAGREPPAAALTWLLDRLAREPEHAARFAAGCGGDRPPLAATADRFGPDPARAGFVREALRLRPAVHSVMRRLTSPATIAGRPLPAGIVALAPMILLHRDAGAFPDPARFDPGRWLGGGADERAFLPFGGGARRCLGEALAHLEIATVLPVVMRRLCLTPVWPQPERMLIRGTVTVPHHGGLVIARDR